jgi:hypothetical protein
MQMLEHTSSGNSVCSTCEFSYFVDFHLSSLLIGALVMGIFRCSQTATTLTFQLHDDKGNGSVEAKRQDCLASDEVEVREMGVWLVKLDPNRHDDWLTRPSGIPR